jgi:hypothetical protein
MTGLDLKQLADVLPEGHVMWGQLEAVEPAGDGLVKVIVLSREEVRLVDESLLEQLQGLVGKKVVIGHIEGGWRAGKHRGDGLKEVGPGYEALGLPLQDITSDLREIIGLLSKGPKRAHDIAMVCNLGDGAVQDRIRRLKEVGIVERETISRTMNGRTFTAPTKRYKLTPAYLSGAVQL